MADIDELAQRLDHELPDVRWDEPDRIRRRGRDRARTRSVGLAAAAVLVIVAGAGWLAAGTRSTPAVPASPPPAEHTSTPTDPPAAGDAPIDGSRLFPKAALLQPGDVGSGYQLTNDNGYSPGSYPTWTFASNGCPEYETLNITAYRSYLWFRHANLEKDRAPSVFVEGHTMPPGGATTVVGDVDRVVAACSRWEVTGGEATSEDRPGTTTTSYTMLAKDFAGDQSRLVRRDVETVGADGARLYAGSVTIAMVRVGDRLSTVMMEEDAPERVRSLAERAAQRLCAATDSGC